MDSISELPPPPPPETPVVPEVVVEEPVVVPATPGLPEQVYNREVDAASVASVDQ